LAWAWRNGGEAAERTGNTQKNNAKEGVFSPSGYKRRFSAQLRAASVQEERTLRRRLENARGLLGGVKDGA